MLYHTARSVILHGVTFFANIFAKTNFSAKPFRLFIRDPDRFIKEKNTKKYRDTASLSKVVFHGDFKMSSVLYSIVRGRRMVKSKQVCSPFAEIYTGQFKNVALKERLS